MHYYAKFYILHSDIGFLHKSKSKKQKRDTGACAIFYFIFELLIRAAGSSPQEPGIGDVFDGSGDRAGLVAAFAGAEGRSRGA